MRVQLVRKTVVALSSLFFLFTVTSLKSFAQDVVEQSANGGADGESLLQQFDPTGVIEVRLSHQNVIKSKYKLVKTAVADPGISEPVMVAENEFVLLGKHLGSTTLTLWDEKGNLIVKEVHVVRELTNSKPNSWGWLEHLLAGIGLVASAKWTYCIAKRKLKKSDDKAEGANPDGKNLEGTNAESTNAEPKNAVGESSSESKNPEGIDGSTTTVEGEKLESVRA